MVLSGLVCVCACVCVYLCLCFCLRARVRTRACVCGDSNRYKQSGTTVLRGVDDIFTLLDDHIVKIDTMLGACVACVGAWVRGCVGTWVRGCMRACLCVLVDARACVGACVCACVRHI